MEKTTKCSACGYEWNQEGESLTDEGEYKPPFLESAVDTLFHDGLDYRTCTILACPKCKTLRLA